jgi:chloramphenicol 3-O phosphotransferase
MSEPVVIIVNGISSVGKSTTARKLQKITRDPFLHVQGDAFLEMLPRRLMDHPDGIVFRTLADKDGPSIAIDIGPAVERNMRGMRAAVSAMAKEGNSLIVDDVMLRSEEQRFYREKLSGIRHHFVGLVATLEVLEQRERDRGDRLIGLAKWQWERVHVGMDYELTLNTGELSAEECAKAIAKKFGIGI